MVRFRVEIAFILGSHRDNDCNHIWSPLLLRLLSYLVPIITSIAVIFGPFHKNYCNHKWSTPDIEKFENLPDALKSGNVRLCAGISSTKFRILGSFFILSLSDLISFIRINHSYLK